MKYLIGNTLVSSYYGQENHLYSALVNGSSCSGKSYFLKKFIQDTIRLNPKANIKFMIVDPKGDTEWENVVPQKYIYKDIVRFKADSKIDKVIFESLVIEEIEEIITQRRILFQRFGVNNYYDYNTKETTISLPIIYLVIDELIFIRELFYNDNYSTFQKVEEWITNCKDLGIIPIYATHRYTGMMKAPIRNLAALRVAMRSEKRLEDLFNLGELKIIEDKKLKLCNDIPGEFIAKLGKRESGWIKYSYDYL